MTDRHLTCGDAAILISASLDGELSPEEQSSLDAHLAECPACCRALADAASLRELARASLRTPEDALTANVRAAVRADARARRLSRLARRASAAAAALLVAVGLLLAGQSVRAAQRNDAAPEAQPACDSGDPKTAGNTCSTPPTGAESAEMEDEATTDRGTAVIAGTTAVTANVPSLPEEAKEFPYSAAAGGCFLAAAAILVAVRRKETQ